MRHFLIIHTVTAHEDIASNKFRYYTFRSHPGTGKGLSVSEVMRTHEDKHIHLVKLPKGMWKKLNIKNLWLLN